MRALEHYGRELEDLKTSINTVKQFDDDQKLFLFQGGHGDHRVRRNNVQTRKTKPAGAGVV